MRCLQRFWFISVLLTVFAVGWFSHWAFVERPSTKPQVRVVRSPFEEFPGTKTDWLTYYEARVAQNGDGWCYVRLRDEDGVLVADGWLGVYDLEGAAVIVRSIVRSQ